MSSDSDEPLSSLKSAISGPSKVAEDPDFEIKKPRRRKKRKVQKLKLVLRPPSESPILFPPKERNVRYYASQAAVERPQDVWLYIKDLNPSGPYSCLLCTEWFLNKAKLVVHFVLNHKKDYCGICRYFVDNRETWLLHCEYHVPVNCSQCPMQFPTEADLRVHFSDVHGSVHCRFCTFMMPNEQYNNHLYQRHKITDVSNKDLPVIWETEYEGSPKFNCALCVKSGTAAVEFVNHYMAYHKFVLKCFAALLSGFDVPFSVYGANISNSFLESALNKHARVGYVERDRSLEAQKVLQEADAVQGSIGLFRALIPEIKQEALSGTEDNVELMEVEIENEDPKPVKKPKTTKDDPIMNYKGEEDFDITLSELIIMNNSYVDYFNIAIQCIQSNTVSIDSKITYGAPNEEGMTFQCALCPAEFTSMHTLGSHMVKMHGVKRVPTFFCRLCVATFDHESEYNSHSTEELADFENLWICQFCDMEFDSRESARKHLNDHYSELKIDNCFSPHLGFKCRYCPTLFWNELDREGHHNRVHFTKHKDDFYKCIECSDMFSDKTWFVHHTRHCHPDSPSTYMMKCAVCCHVFPTVSEVKEHFYKEHPEATKIFCSLDSCRFRPFSQSKSFKMHLQTFHGRDSRQQERTSCVVCDREFPSVRACSSHMATAHGPGRFKCKLCGDVLQSSDERKLHYMLQHPGQLPHECNVCKRSFQNKSSLYMHRQEHHDNGDNFKCKYCGKRFMKKDSFREHVLIHEGPRHTCSYCPMRFVQRSNMLRHERRHTGERPYSCSYCGRAFSDKGACNSHMRIHKPHEANPCPYCGQTFAQKSKLRYHIRRHTGEDLETCYVCSKRFTSMPSLKEHMKTHNGSTGLETCYVCSKLFTSVSAVREHMKTHEEGQRNTCPICNRVFQSYSSMGRHMRNNHSDESAKMSCPLCETTMMNLVALRYHVMTHSKVKHVKCRVCNKDYSCRKTMVKHLQLKHGVEGPSETIRSFYTELDPRQCQLGLDEATISNIFGPTKNTDTDVIIPDYITFPNVVPTKSQDSDQREEAETEVEEEGNSEEPAEEQAVSEAVLKKKKKITYEYEEIVGAREIPAKSLYSLFKNLGGKKKKKHKKKKKKDKKRRKSSEAESEGPAEAEKAPQEETEPTDFITIKLEPINDEVDYQD